jgi:kinetochore protein NDC80
MNRPTARRQTLGQVNVNTGTENAGHRRQSVGPTSVPPKARPPTGRASMIPRGVGRENVIPPTLPSTNPRPTNNARRSSVGGDRGQALPLPPLSVPTKTDPRQVTDRVFQQNCIKKLLKYLIDHGYDHPITHKSLARPSGKDFNHIVTFLFRQVDPNFQDGTMKIEDEVAMNFKALGYPFPVSKTSLVAAGSPHAWPTLLAAVTWLTERIQLLHVTVPDMPESDNFESLEELEIKTDKAFFRYLSASYTAFLRGDEQATEELELALAEQFEKDDVIIEREIEQMTDKNAVIVEQINNMTMGENE